MSPDTMRNPRTILIGAGAGIYGSAVIALLLVPSRGPDAGVNQVITSVVQDPSVLSAIGTFGLVLLTAVYTYQTRQLVETQYQARKQERMETWYGETITTVRRIERDWRFLLRHRAPNGVVRLNESETIFTELKELTDTLDSQIAGRPREIDRDLVDAADEFLEDWKQLAASEDPEFSHAHDGLAQLRDIRHHIEQHSDWYG